MSSIKKVLCLKVNDTCPRERLLTPGVSYDVVSESLMPFKTGVGFIINDNHGRPTTIIIGDGSNCIYGEWQPLEEYMCMTNIFNPHVKIGDVIFGYKDGGALHCPLNRKIFGCTEHQFKPLAELQSKPTPNPRHEVRHVVYDTKDNKIVNDAMGECYITLAEAQELCDEMNAPKVMKPKYTKEVEYFGMNVFVPDDTMWLSTTMNGTLFAHCSKTAPSESVCFHTGSDDHVVMGGIDLNGIDWKDTLVEIK